MLSIFHLLVGHLYIISIQMSIQALYLFLNQVILFYFILSLLLCLSTWTHGNSLSLHTEPCASQLAAHMNSVCLLDHILTFQNLVLSGNPGN